MSSPSLEKQRHRTDELAATTSPHRPSLPSELEDSAVMRFAGMPLEKIALFMNSSLVNGSNQFRQAVKLTFEKGMLAPYRVVTSASLVAWFMQYSVMGLAFQAFDHALSKGLGVEPVWYGEELMKPYTDEPSNDRDASYRAKVALKIVAAPILAGSLESVVANRAEVERYFGPRQFAAIESKLGWNPVARIFAPSFAANAARNVIMCNVSFVVTPITYKLWFPQEKKSQASLFYYGMGVNFIGNGIAITQQALWGRALDYAAVGGGQKINYSDVIRLSLKEDGYGAFFSVAKWTSRILMNAPVQGSLPWFYNNILPRGEESVVNAAAMLVGGVAGREEIN
ncbi:hypothetical protein THAOC_26946 [Thalassiosira oceanica]|uniref:Uncharacterized protein n=1 Tax=Thalassiosira oceanica TaxID=159749 RepID=K0RK35_THAOC|nr:hypothetical protein THAOC_26946 [Thalassiosira oceanica]|eukprot:EJK53585.1 hypothetical protein THAOC_26946 [Thalassiosira oceanica]